MNLFQKVDFIGHAGQPLDFKIECDNLTDDDLQCCAYLLSKRLPPFRGDYCSVREDFHVAGIPTGGINIASAMDQYQTDDPGAPVLICDDVYTTGTSFKDYAKNFKVPVIGAVIFARGPVKQWWITPLFQLTGEL